MESKYVAIDTETTGLNPYRPDVHAEIISWWSGDKGGIVRVTKHKNFYEFGGIKDLEFIAKVLSDRKVTKLFFNAKFDIAILKKLGLRIRGRVIDTSIMARMCYPDERTNTLKHFSRKFLDDPYIEEVTLKKYIRENKIDTKSRGYADIPSHILYPYAIKDAEMTYRLFGILSPEIQRMGNGSILKNEMRLMPIVLKMEERGVKLNRKKGIRLFEKAEEELVRVKQKLRGLTDDPHFNPNSNPQIVKHLYKNNPVTRYSHRSGNPSADKFALLEIGDEFCQNLLRWRQLSKVTGTYLTNYLKATDDQDILRVSFNQGGARTGRFSSSGFDVKGQLQNTPRPSDKPIVGSIRELFIPRDSRYRFGLNDFDQLEARLAAHFSDDKRLIDAIIHGEDIHGVATTRTFGVKPGDKKWNFYRYVQKTINYLAQYGGGVERLVETVYEDTDGEFLLTAEEASEYLEKFWISNEPLDKLFEKVAEEIANTGGIRNFYGRFCPVNPDTPYVGVNYLIQGTAADLIKDRMIHCHYRLMDSYDSHMILQVHDELIFEIHHKDGISLIHDLADIMEDRKNFSVPLTISRNLGISWGQKKELPRF